MTELSREERSKICDAFQTGHWLSVVHAVEDLIDQRDIDEQQRRVAERLAEHERSRMAAGHIEGYTPVCGKIEAHFGHRMAYTNEYCSGYCDCKYRAPFPHSSGEHK